MLRLFEPDTRTGFYRSPDDPPAGGGPPAPAPAPVPAPPPTPAPPQDNAENAAQRLLKKAQDRVTELEAAEEARKTAELSEVDRLKKEAADNKTAAEAARLETLRLKAGKDLPDEALEFLTGTDEATLAAQAEKLRKVYPAAPASAGTLTNPPANQAPSVDEQIAAAEKAGNGLQAIRLKMEKMRAG